MIPQCFMLGMKKSSCFGLTSSKVGAVSMEMLMRTKPSCLIQWQSEGPEYMLKGSSFACRSQDGGINFWLQRSVLGQSYCHWRKSEIFYEKT